MRRTLVARFAVVVALFLIVIAVFWFDRDGLRDDADGSISFTDVVYFSAGGQVMLAEREPRPEEIGRRPVDVGHSLIVRVIRGAQAYSFWEQPATIQAGDKLIVLHSRAAAPGA